MLAYCSKILFGVGVSCGLYCVYYEGVGAFQQWSGKRALEKALNSAVPRAVLRIGDLIGRIEIPSVQLSAVIFEGTDESQLIRGVGHWVGSSPVPGEGNLVLAAHRDTFFRSLRDVRENDEIVLAVPGGDVKYRVISLSVVTPDSVNVLEPTIQPTLTLITCYPFDFFGSAPERFIVRALKE